MPKPVAPTPVDSIPGAEPKNIELSDTDFFKIMRDSVSSASVTEFKTNQVTDWKRLGKKAVDGVEYDEGVATYKAIRSSVIRA